MSSWNTLRQRQASIFSFCEVSQPQPQSDLEFSLPLRFKPQLPAPKSPLPKLSSSTQMVTALKDNAEARKISKQRKKLMASKSVQEEIQHLKQEKKKRRKAVEVEKLVMKDSDLDFQNSNHNNDSGAQSIPLPKNNLVSDIRLEKSGVVNDSQRSKVRNSLKNSVKVSKLRISNLNALQQNLLSEKKQKKQNSEEAFGSGCVSMYDQSQGSENFVQPYFLTLSRLQRDAENNPENMLPSINEHTIQNEFVYLPKGKCEQVQQYDEWSPRQPNVFKKKAIQISQEVSFSQLLYPKKKKVSLNPFEKIGPAIPVQKKQNQKVSSLVKQVLAQLLIESIPHPKAYEELGVLLINSHYQLQQPRPQQLAQQSANLSVYKVVERLQKMIAPPEVAAVEGCFVCEKNKGIILNYWQQLRHHHSQQTQMKSQIRSLTTRVQDLQKMYDSTCKQLKERQKEIEGMIKLMNERRVWRDAEVELFNNDALHRNLEAVEIHNKILNTVVDINHVMHEAARHCALETLKQEHLDDMKRNFAEQNMLRKELKSVREGEANLQNTFNDMYNQVSQALQSYKEKTQSQAERIHRLEKQVGELNNICWSNQEYIEHLEDLVEASEKKAIDTERNYIRQLLALKEQRIKLLSTIRQLQEE